MNMLSKFIIIENNKDYQCNTFEDVVKYFIDENYYNLTMAEQKNKIMKIAIDNAIDNNLKIVKIVENIDNINESFIAIDEITVILSILKNQLRIVLLERKEEILLVDDEILEDIIKKMQKQVEKNKSV